jgi:hypothetical protein
MSDNSNKSEDAGIVHVHEVELSERELFCIGHIIAQWGALEHEIFSQTLQTFEEHIQTLPKEMNNIQFSSVLEKWKERVVDQCNGEKKKNLQEQYALIRHYRDYRNALTHGMWDWDKASPDRIRTTRVHKREVISTHFTAADLEDFSLEVAKINFNIRYPRGIEDLAEETINRGGYIGRLTASMLSGHTMASEPASDKAAAGLRQHHADAAASTTLLPKSQESLKSSRSGRQELAAHCRRGDR